MSNYFLSLGKKPRKVLPLSDIVRDVEMGKIESCQIRVLRETKRGNVDPSRHNNHKNSV